MGKKTVWIICTINILAGGFAIAWVTQPYWQPRPKQPFTEVAEAAKPARKDADTCWAEFRAASTHEGARHALAGMAADERQSRLTAFLFSEEPNVEMGETAVVATRQAAAVAFWGESAETGSAEDDWLRALALDRSRSALEREAALRALIFAAKRKHEASAGAAAGADEDTDESWREALAEYLEQGDFGPGSSVQGLALQARSFALLETIAPISRDALLQDIGRLLLPKNEASEAVVLAALDVARQLDAAELLMMVRMTARYPQSEAVQQAAFRYLLEQGTREDLSWFSEYTPASASAQLFAANVRAALAQRLRDTQPDAERTPETSAEPDGSSEAQSEANAEKEAQRSDGA